MKVSQTPKVSFINLADEASAKKFSANTSKSEQGATTSKPIVILNEFDSITYREVSNRESKVFTHAPTSAWFKSSTTSFTDNLHGVQVVEEVVVELEVVEITASVHP